MAVNGGNFNDDEFEDLEPVLDEDSFSFDLDEEDPLSVKDTESLDPDMEQPGLDEVGLDDLDFNDTGLDDMVASSGDEYPNEDKPETNIDSDNNDLDDFDFGSNELGSEPFESNETEPGEAEPITDLETNSEDVAEDDGFKDLTDNTPSNESVDLDMDFDLDLDLDEDDPQIDEKIAELVDEKEADEAPDSTSETENSEEFDFDDLDEEDESITLSMDELENITGEAEIDPDSETERESLELDGENISDTAPTHTPVLDDEFSDLAEDNALSDLEEDPFSEESDSWESSDDQIMHSDSESSLDTNLNKKGTDSQSEESGSFTDEELDEILGADIFEEEEDLSDEPIALSMDELENIMSDDPPSETVEEEPATPDVISDTTPDTTTDSSEEEDSFSDGEPSDSDSDLGLDLDIHTPPSEDKLKEDLDFGEIIEEERSADDWEEASEPVDDHDYDQGSFSLDEEGDPLEKDNLFDDDDIADEPITLSMDELSAITGEEDTEEDTEEDEFDSLPTPDDTVDFDEFSLGDEEVSSEDVNLLTESEENNQQEDLTLSDEELGNILGAEDELPANDVFNQDDEITLLPETEESEELGETEAEEGSDDSVFGLEWDDEAEEEDQHSRDQEEESKEQEKEKDQDQEEQEEFLDSVDSEGFEGLEDSEDSIETGDSQDEINFDPEEDMADEPITLSTDELNDIIGEIPPGEDLEDLSQVREEIIEPEEDLGFDQAEEEEPESVQEAVIPEEPESAEEAEMPEELETTEEAELSEEAPIHTEAEESESPGMEENTERATTPTLDLNKPVEPEFIDIDEYAEEGGLSPKEELRSSPAPEPGKEESISSEEDSSESQEKDMDGLSPEEKKKVLSYLDNLLGNLPDDLIREFSKSNYFDLYKKMMKEIGL